MKKLYQAWESLKNTTPYLSTSEAAKQLQVTEGELIASRVGVDVVKLTPQWEALFTAVGKLGQVMAFTRNEYCIHERHGVYVDPMIGEDNRIGLIISPDIDLRFMLANWGSVFAVTDKVPEKISDTGILNSIQIFDKQGQAVHKIYVINTSNHEQWNPLVEQFKDEHQSSQLTLEEKAEQPPYTDISQIDHEAFKKEWAALTDTHQFDPLLKRYNVNRAKALSLGGKELAEELPANALPSLFEKAAQEQLKIMVFVGNDGCVQIHTGTIEKITVSNGWFNILDPLFNLHLRPEAVNKLWLVRKPTSDGMVTSIEAYDTNNELILQLYGPRRSGIPERKAWREFVESCPRLGA